MKSLKLFMEKKTMLKFLRTLSTLKSDLKCDQMVCLVPPFNFDNSYELGM